MNTEQTTTYVSAVGWARVLRWMLAGWVVLAGFSAGMHWTYAALLDGRHGAERAADLLRLEGALNAFVVIDLVAMLACGVVFIGWTRRLYRNIDELGGARRFTPGWAVGAWFVPILNFWRPRQVLDDVWRTSSPERWQGTQAMGRSGLLDAWWAAFIIAGIGSRIANAGLASEDVNAGDIRFTGVVDLLYLAAAVLAFWVVTRITEEQEAHAAHAQLVGEGRRFSHSAWLYWLLPTLGFASIVSAAVLVVPSASSGGAGRVAAALEPGDCFDLPIDAQDAYFMLGTVDLVDCDALHGAEVYALDVERWPGGARWTDADSVFQAAEEWCYTQFSGFVEVAVEDSMYSYSVLYPSEDSWHFGDRAVTCIVHRSDYVPTRRTAEAVRR